MSGPRTITLPDPIADALAARVASGDYASESEVIHAGLMALEAQDTAIEDWVAREGAQRYDAWRADSARATPAADAFARIRRDLGDASET